MGTTLEDSRNREIRISRTFKAPVALVWEAWTSPGHIKNWWGPDGFTTTVHQMDMQKGGEWRLTMHGPDGTDYANRSKYHEVIPLKKIVFEHFNPHFFTTVTFEAHGSETFMEWVMLFDTVELRDIVVKAHKADEGLKQNVEKLANYLEQMAQLPGA